MSEVGDAELGVSLTRSVAGLPVRILNEERPSSTDSRLVIVWLL